MPDCILRIPGRRIKDAYEANLGSRWVAGVDGCPVGWVIVRRDRQERTHRAGVVPDFRALLALTETPSMIAVDVPMGLLATARAGGRGCEVLARRLFGTRASSVSSAPTRAALAAFRAGSGYQAGATANRADVANAPGTSGQTFGILARSTKSTGYSFLRRRTSCARCIPSCASRRRTEARPTFSQLP